MKNEQAIECLKGLKWFWSRKIEGDFVYAETLQQIQALNMAIKALEGNGVAQERKYTFANDEFNLEAAYNDCKLVFDGITDDDSFQEADTGLILYYANEIIYALHKALKGKDTNVPSNDFVSRQDAIDIIDMDKMKPEIAPSLGSTAERDFKIYNHSCNKHIELIKQLPSAQTEQRKGKWIDDTCTECGYGVQPWNNTPFCPRCGSYNGGADMRGDENETD